MSWRRFLFAVAIIAVPAATASASIIISFDDPFDKTAIVNQVIDDPRVKTFHEHLTAFKKKLLPLKPRDFEALFGKPVAKPDKKYAFPTAERRALGLSGLRYADEKMNKDHTDFHVVGEHAALEVWYGIDGETVAAIVVFLKPDKQFIVLDDADKLGQRLGWDRDKFQKLVWHYERQRASVFVWEIDDKARKQLQGVDSPDFAEKLKAWKKWGEAESLKLDYRLPDANSSPHWRWHDAKGKLVTEVMTGETGADAKPHQFHVLHANGNPLREEWGDTHLQSVRWQTPELKNIRYDTGCMVNGRWQGSSWTWWNQKEKTVRVERDDNDDGIPDWVKEGPADKDSKDLKVERLTIEKSWAINPELIPKECRVPDQAARRVPIRRIVAP